MHNDIKSWIEHLSIPRDELGGFSICPFARSSSYEIIETDGGDINPPPWKFELIIYKLPDNYSTQEVFDLASEYNKLMPDFIFLPDPKDRKTEINKVHTNNGKYNLILCQWRDDLQASREKLLKTKYYSYWNNEYLQEILES